MQGGGGIDEASVQDLKDDNEKLRTLVSVGQDASRQQDQLIEQLQSELAAIKVGGGCGGGRQLLGVMVDFSVKFIYFFLFLHKVGDGERSKSCCH